MLHKDTLFFLADLKGNNHKTWFDENRKRYDAIRKDLVKFVGAIIEEISAFDSEIEGIDPSKTLFRINRDIRFSKDKSPYKINLGAHIASKSGKEAGQVGYYLHLEPEGNFMGGGIYMPEAETLRKIREYTDENGAELTRIISDPEFIATFGTLQGERLKGTPKGYSKDHPYADFLSMKDMYVLHKVSDEDIQSGNLLEMAVSVFRTQYPLNTFLRKAIRRD